MKIENGILSEVYKTNGKDSGVFIIPDNVKIIGEAAFDCCSFSSIIIPDGVKRIKPYAFRNCLSLQNIKMPNSVKSIEMFAFFGCKTLQSVIINDNVRFIGRYAFAYCWKLKEIVLPYYLKTIDKDAFIYMSYESTIVYNEQQISFAKSLEDEYGDNINLLLRPYDCEIF